MNRGVHSSKEHSSRGRGGSDASCLCRRGVEAKALRITSIEEVAVAAFARLLLGLAPLLASTGLERSPLPQQLLPLSTLLSD